MHEVIEKRRGCLAVAVLLEDRAQGGHLAALGGDIQALGVGVESREQDVLGGLRSEMDSGCGRRAGSRSSIIGIGHGSWMCLRKGEVVTGQQNLS